MHSPLSFTRVKIPLLCGLAALMVAAPARAQIATLDGPSPIEYGAALNTASFTVSSGATVLVVFYGSRTQGDSPSADAGTPALSWNGNALTKAVTQSSTASTWDDNSIYYLINPPAGTGTITEAANPTGVNQIWWMAYTLTGVDTTKGVLTGSVGNGSASTVNDTVSNIVAGSWAAYATSGSATGVILTVTESPAGGTVSPNVSSASGNATQSMGSVANCPAGNIEFITTDNTTGQKIVLCEAVFTPMVSGPGAVSQNPSSLTAFPGQTITLTGAGTGAPTLNYLWASNSVNLTDGGGISGSATPVLTISNVVAADAASYTLSVSNTIGGAISTPPAVLTVHAFYAPINITLTNFEAAGLDWNSTGAWNDGLGSLPASTSAFEAPGSTYEVLPGFQLRTPGETPLPFTNFPGVQLTIDGNGVFTNNPNQGTAVGQLKFKQGATNNNVVSFPLLIMAGGQLDNDNAGTAEIQGTINIVSNTPIYVDTAGADFRPFQIDGIIEGNGSIEFHDFDATETGGLYITGVSNTYTGTWNVVQGPLVGGGLNSLGTNNITVGANAVLETLYDDSSPNAVLTLNGRMFLHQNDTFGYLVVNGVGVAAGVYPFATLAATYPATFPAAWTAVFGSTISSRSVGGITVLSNYVAPAIGGQPQPVAAYEGATVTFTASGITGTGPLTYQWQYNGVNLANGGGISGVTTPILTISDAVLGDTGSYQLLVLSPSGTLPSSSASLTVSAPVANVPANIVQNNDPGVCGAVVNFTLPPETNNAGLSNVVATPVSGSTFPIGTTPVTVVLTDIFGDVASNTFSVTVVDAQPPAITTPGNIVQAFDAGQLYATVTFSVSATDNCGVSSVVATPPSGSEFPVGVNTVTVVATDVNGNSATNIFTVTASGLPQITSQPASQTYVNGGTASFTVGASSPAPLVYQWFDNSSPLSDGGRISGSSTETLTIVNLTNTDAASYSVVVSNVAGSVISTSAVLTVVSPQLTTNYFYYQGNQSGSPGTNWFGTGTTGNYWTNTFTGAKTYPTAGTVSTFATNYNFYVLTNNGIQLGNGTATTLSRPPYTSPTLAVVPFPGDTLILQTNTTIRFKNVGGSNTFVTGVTITTPTYSFPGNYGIPGLMLDGGALNCGNTGQANVIMGSIYAVPGSQSYLLPSDTLNQDAVLRALIIQAQLTGSGALVLLNGDSEPAGTAPAPQPFTGTSNNFTGEWIVKSGWLQGVGDGTVDGYNSLGTNPAVVFDIDPLWVPPSWRQQRQLRLQQQSCSGRARRRRKLLFLQRSGCSRPGY